MFFELQNQIRVANLKSRYVYFNFMCQTFWKYLHLISFFYSLLLVLPCEINQSKDPLHLFGSTLLPRWKLPSHFLFPIFCEHMWLVNEEKKTVNKGKKTIHFSWPSDVGLGSWSVFRSRSQVRLPLSFVWEFGGRGSKGFWKHKNIKEN